MSIADNTYHETRLEEDNRRDVLWRTLWDAYFKKEIAPTDSVLDIGAGYGQFINNVVAKHRYALDIWSGMTTHLQDDITPLVGGLSRLEELPDCSIDYAFASNLFEHVTQDDFAMALSHLKTNHDHPPKLLLPFAFTL